VVGCSDHGNEPLDSIKGGEFLDHLSSMDLVTRPLESYLFTYFLHGARYYLKS
jgi:hypothetical protein